jgi:hypothetical protein
MSDAAALADPPHVPQDDKLSRAAARAASSLITMLAIFPLRHRQRPANCGVERLPRPPDRLSSIDNFGIWNIRTCRRSQGVGATLP